ncbi:MULTISPECIES: TetR/AcrR family transcriptional regulator [unclassified Halorubrum]|uniref:TetR/AcrR family transcriptional regulator n=1 Tax=unclassified Halorubrum TaxID=2642239 RepID=UPI0010F6E8BB|nr:MULTISPECIES: TetR/AcrR family transcriptional regulator [unclassified Halorubrum]TKX40248.1 TetR/AcrR family transcriptional regulator [Halorubrum sp. CGM4_25_10-8A]TKX65924.1 TetR/AcrR family transcriptional regulator [Halorubrum sp. GN12_10-3_MGM]
MARFTDEDRERIREELIEAGHKLFAQFGFDRTRVNDITEEVGIGTSTFYQFFDSKEQLYLVVLVSERDQLFEQLEAVIGEVETPQAEAEMILRTTLKQVRSNPLIRRLFVEGEIRRIDEQLNGTNYDDGTSTGDNNNTGTISKGDGDNKPDTGAEADFRVLPQPEAWVARDDVRIDDPDIVRGLLRSLLFVTQAQNTPIVLNETYDEVEEALIDTVITGLFADESMTSCDDHSG